jgi:hypothetical protein
MHGFRNNEGLQIGAGGNFDDAAVRGPVDRGLERRGPREIEWGLSGRWNGGDAGDAKLRLPSGRGLRGGLVRRDFAERRNDGDRHGRDGRLRKNPRRRAANGTTGKGGGGVPRGWRNKFPGRSRGRGRRPWSVGEIISLFLWNGRVSINGFLNKNFQRGPFM